MTSLRCRNNSLTSLDVAANDSLQHLFCSGNDLTTLDVSANANLLTLSVGSNDLTSVNINGLAMLKELYVNNNNLTSVNTSTNPALEDYYCSDNQMSSIDISNNSMIQYLSIGFNQLIGILDISHLNQLESIIFSENQLTGFVVGNNPVLTTIKADDNLLSSIDVSSLPQLDEFICRGNLLTYLNVKNGNNTNFTYFNALNTPNLICIEVDDPAYSTATTAIWQKEAIASYSSSCGPVATPESSLTEANVQIYPNPSKGVFNIELQRKGKYTLSISDVFGKTIYDLEQPTSGAQKANLNAFPKGIYFLRLAQGGRVLTKRISIR